MKGFVVLIRNKKHKTIAILFSTSKKIVEDRMVEYSMQYPKESHRAIIMDQRDRDYYSMTEYIKL